MRQAGLAPLSTAANIAVPLAVTFVVLMGVAPGIAVAADAPVVRPVVPVAAPASAAAPAPPAGPAPIVGRGDAGRRLYTSLCVYCHHLGERVSEVGAPGLTGAVHRYGEAWLEHWLADPAGFAKRDTKAGALVAANPYGLVMPALSAMQDAQNRADVIAFLKGLETGDAKGDTSAQ